MHIPKPLSPGWVSINWMVKLTTPATNLLVKADPYIYDNMYSSLIHYRYGLFVTKVVFDGIVLSSPFHWVQTIPLLL